MHIKRMLKEMIKNEKIEDMEYLAEVCVDAIYNLKHTNPMWYHNIEVTMHKKAYGEHLRAEEVKCITSMLVNKDGTKGEHWDFDTIEGVMKERNITCKPCDFYFAMNIVYAMYGNSKFDVNIYVEMAHDYMRTHDLVVEFYKHRALLK